MATRAAGWVAGADHAATACPECFQDDPSVVRIFMNGARTFGGVEPMRMATLPWGAAGSEAKVNEWVGRLPPRLSDEDVAIAPEQWAK